MQSEPLWVSGKLQKLPQRGLNVLREDGWREGKKPEGPMGLDSGRPAEEAPWGWKQRSVVPCSTFVPSLNWPLQARRKMFLFLRPGSLRQDLLSLLSPPPAPVFLGNRPVGNMFGD